jgi:Pyruvate/2-oxoacid:ferredoxin oxidoreductase delta subunit
MGTLGVILIVMGGLAAAPVLGLLALWVIGERGHVFGLPSTRLAIRQRESSKLDSATGRPVGGGTPNTPIKLLHGYVYARFANQYIDFAIKHLLPRMSPGFKETWADHYHGKVLTPELASAIITLDHDIPLTDLEQIIPYPTARQIVLDGPPEVVAFDCPCRASRENPCQPVQVCMIIGDGGFVLDHHPNASRRLSQQEALDLLKAEHERGHVHVAYFKDACNDRFYAICNCCTCCCGGLEAMRGGMPKVAASGYLAVVDEAACQGCETCADLCPFGAIAVNGHAAVRVEACMGCGVCVDHCPNGALALVEDARRGIPLDVRKLG